MYIYGRHLHLLQTWTTSSHFFFSEENISENILIAIIDKFVIFGELFFIDVQKVKLMTYILRKCSTRSPGVREGRLLIYLEVQFG